VMIVFLLSALDQTIVSTAMPVIISQLHGLELYAWVTTAYLLSSTVMVPIWGKLGDLYGRKPILLAGIGLFLFGSWLAGLAGEFGDLPLLGGGMVQLVVFRAVQGLGGGALFTTAFASFSRDIMKSQACPHAPRWTSFWGITAARLWACIAMKPTSSASWSTAGRSSGCGRKSPSEAVLRDMVQGLIRNT